MNKAFLLIGGNSGDRKLNLALAVELITAKAGNILQQSHIYETAAWGITDQNAFLNQALFIETTLQPTELIDVLLDIEVSMGRIRTVKYGPRLIDLDIIYYNEEVIQTETLIIPHPAMQERRFVLVPLAEIAPSFMHPVLNKNNQQLLDGCPDKLEVTLWE